ncbi:TIGR02147 family protein [Bdellovibrio sp. KM01]|uniref:TIGR02147 family protein n=1 Tax=Bdellovibrio sp. KM01 TaxID=2748865 RepID=UPI0015E941E3|nr:TIGR02147 family protein [Bdellovibrio sp. KM01]QLY26258.1 TIGR02147 family protein [Bdellovibrio sp. KM01]
MTKAEILKYKDYRQFLADYNAWKSQNKVGWSLTVWTRQLGLSHPSALSMILNRKRHIGDKLADSISDYFEFNENEKTHFSNLVKYEKSIDSNHLRIMVLNELQGEKNNAIARFVLNEGNKLQKFENRAQLVAALSPILGMSPEDLIALEARTPEAPDAKAMHLEVVKILERSYDVVPKAKRQYAATFMRMKAERMEEAIAKLRAFQKEFIAEFDCEDADQLVCFQNSLFSMINEEGTESGPQLPHHKKN